MPTLDDETLGKTDDGPQTLVQRDIFGNEFVGTKQVLRLVLDPAELPEGARRVLATVKRFALEEATLSGALTAALGQVPDEFWQQKLQALTPLEWKLLAALENPQFRAEVKALLSTTRQPPSQRAND